MHCFWFYQETAHNVPALLICHLVMQALCLKITCGNYSPQGRELVNEVGVVLKCDTA